MIFIFPFIWSCSTLKHFDLNTLCCEILVILLQVYKHILAFKFFCKLQFFLDYVPNSWCSLAIFGSFFFIICVVVGQEELLYCPILLLAWILHDIFIVFFFLKKLLFQVGFEMLDAIAEAEGISVSTVQFKALFGKGILLLLVSLLCFKRNFVRTWHYQVLFSLSSLSSTAQWITEQFLALNRRLSLSFDKRKIKPIPYGCV